MSMSVNLKHNNYSSSICIFNYGSYIYCRIDSSDFIALTELGNSVDFHWKAILIHYVSMWHVEFREKHTVYNLKSSSLI